MIETPRENSSVLIFCVRLMRVGSDRSFLPRPRSRPSDTTEPHRLDRPLQSSLDSPLGSAGPLGAVYWVIRAARCLRVRAAHGQSVARRLRCGRAAIDPPARPPVSFALGLCCGVVARLPRALGGHLRCTWRGVLLTLLTGILSS